MFLMAVLGLLLAQDPDVDALLKQLEDEAIEVREKAAAALAELGDKAEEKVKARMASAGGELKNLCRKILKGIAISKKLRGDLPPLRKVTIDAKDAKLKEVLEDLQRQSGMPMSFDGLGDAAVTVQVKNAAPLEALNAICKAAGLGFQVDNSQSMRGRLAAAGLDARSSIDQGEPSIRFIPGGYAEVPRQFVRHYQVEPTHVSLSQSTNLRTPSYNASLNLQLMWPPGVKPDAVSIELAAVTDDKGRSLYDATRNAGFMKERRMHRHGHMNRSQWDHPVNLIYPAADARSLASVRGSATLMYVMEEKLVSFESPEKEPVQKMEYDGLEVELRECKTSDGTVAVKMVIVGQRKSAPSDASVSRGNFNYQQVRLRMEDGSAPSQSGMSGSGSGVTFSMSLTYQNVRSKVVGIDVVMDTLYFEDKFDFELKDIPLPR